MEDVLFGTIGDQRLYVPGSRDARGAWTRTKYDHCSGRGHDQLIFQVARAWIQPPLGGWRPSKPLLRPAQRFLDGR